MPATLHISAVRRAGALLLYALAASFCATQFEEAAADLGQPRTTNCCARLKPATTPKRWKSGRSCWH
jgi:hypothetical protein